jgi:hypothetical protein
MFPDADVTDLRHRYRKLTENEELLAEEVSAAIVNEFLKNGYTKRAVVSTSGQRHGESVPAS